MPTTELIRAAKLGDVIEVRRLLAAGADPNAASPPRFNAINLAAAHGQTPVVELLIAAGAKPTWDTLMGAAFANHAKTVKVLLAAGAPTKEPGGNLPMRDIPLLNSLQYSGFSREQQRRIREMLREAGVRELPEWYLRWRWSLKYGWRWRLRRWWHLWFTRQPRSAR